MDTGLMYDDIEVPVGIAIQCIQEAALAGASWAAVAPCVVTDGGILLPIIEIPLHPRIMTKIRNEVADFWRRVRENDPYPPDYARDGEVIKDIFAADDGGEVDLSGNERAVKLVAVREELKRIEAAGGDAAKERKPIDAELIHILQNAVSGRLSDGRIIEAKTVHKSGFTVHPTSFRSVKIKNRKWNGV